MKKIIAFALPCFFAFIGYRLATTPTMPIPYPYIVKAPPQEEDIERAQKAHILLVGDRMGQQLGQSLSSHLSSDIYNWSERHEGLHRTLAKLKALDTLGRWPQVLLYHGASEEFYEKKFSLANSKRILKNFEYQENDILSSLIIALPWTSRLIYAPPHFQRLGEEIQKDETAYISSSKQKQMEITYKIFQKELEELIKLNIRNKSLLIVLTTPLNLDKTPKNTCGNAVTHKILAKQKEISKLLRLHRPVEAYRAAKALSEQSINNAQSFFLAGQAAKQLKKFKEARDYLNLASAYDCETWRGNAVFNAIIQKMALKFSENVILLDFHHLVNKDYGKVDSVFFNDLFPKKRYYEDISRILAHIISKSI